MNKKDAIKLMLEGKKVKRKDWMDRIYLCMNEHGNILNSCGREENINNFRNDDWIEYIEDSRKEVPKQMEYLKDLYLILFKENGEQLMPCAGLLCDDCPLKPNESPYRCLQNLMREKLMDINKKWKLDN